MYGWKLACMLLIGVPLIAGAAYQQTLIIRRNQLRDLKLMDSAGRVSNILIYYYFFIKLYIIIL